ncbi:Serine incorporator 3 [Nymphaea thermarum]|nr:Serine incorporator 3 [Nymphaea thermarum]
MKDTIVNVRDKEENVLSLEAVRSEGNAVDGGRLLHYAVETKRALKARYAYGFIFFLTNLLAWVVRDYGHPVTAKLHYLKECHTGKECLHTEGVLRSKKVASRLSFVAFWVVVPKVCHMDFIDADPFLHSFRFHSDIRCVETKSIFRYLFSTDIIRFSVTFVKCDLYRIFLLVQLISVIHFILWWNRCCMPEDKLKHSCFMGLFIATVSYIAALCGIFLMYLWFAGGSSFLLNIFFITWTLVFLKAMMIVSLHSKVNTGLLSSGIMGFYIVFLCWSAIRSEPIDERSNSRKQDYWSGDWTTIVSFLFAVCAIAMVTFSTGIDSNSFQLLKDEVQTEDDVPYKYGFFHAIFSLGAMYFAMLFVSWDLKHSIKKWSIDVGWASTWVKIVNEWFAATIYCKITTKLFLLEVDNPLANYLLLFFSAFEYS